VAVVSSGTSDVVVLKQQHPIYRLWTALSLR
jgi:hypothetical protein